MFAFVRVFAFYLSTAALLTWALFALGWADALEMDGFSNSPSNPIVEKVPQKPVVVASVPVAEQVPKSALPRDSRAPVAEPVMPPAAPVPAAPVKVQAVPPAAAVSTAPKAPEPPAARTAALPMHERGPVVVVPRQPDPPKQEPVRVAPPPAPAPSAAIEARPVPVTPPPAAIPTRQVDLAPAPPTPPAPRSAPPVQATPPPVPSAVQPTPTRSSRWAPTRRIAGFGHDALVDQLDDTRRSSDDIACVVMRELSFKGGASQLAPRTQSELQTIAKVLTLFPGHRIEIGSRLGPGRPMASDARLRSDRTRVVREGLIALGVPATGIVTDTGEGYERVVDDVNRAGGPRVQSIGICVLS